ncbi:sensor histidine kinase [Salmonirosea aquatica]|uniref:histidine kinase n=1 Tax=Salmonirosea aquatica TaxID=2654236 RepID=A0A7C9BET2_9BACT|nr:sensor histidine kinase [Cytophagaceae bacterium SJW1-29]
MTTTRIKWSFVLLGVLAFLASAALIADIPSLAADERLKAFLSGVFVAGALLPILVMIVMGWRTTVSKDSSQNQMDFMYKMTHELQTPVSSISLAADMLATPAVQRSPERIGKYVRMVKEESNRMQWHIDNVLHIAKAENQTLLLRLEKIQVNDLIESVVERYGRKICMELDAEDSTAIVDRQHLANVLRNLLDNALKYTPENPRIIIATQRLNNTLVVNVRDNGIGIAEEEQKKIFDNFYRVPNNTSNVKGFGLGLSYVQQIARAHHWNLELTSQPGVGSEFKITIPAKSAN